MEALNDLFIQFDRDGDLKWGGRADGRRLGPYTSVRVSPSTIYGFPAKDPNNEDGTIAIRGGEDGEWFLVDDDERLLYPIFRVYSHK